MLIEQEKDMDTQIPDTSKDKEQRGLSNLNVGWGVVAALAVEIILMSILSPYFLKVQNLFNVFKSISFIGIVSVGMTMVIIVGGLDLSVGSMVGLGGMITAGLITKGGFHPLLAVFIGLSSGAAIGYIISLFVNKLHINAIIVTLAMLSILKGFTYMISKGSNIFVKTGGIKYLGQGYVGPIPFPVIIMIVIIALGALFLRFTVIGRQIYATGGNERAAKLAGIKVQRIRSLVFILTSTLAAFSGIVMTGMLGSAEISAGNGLELDVIAAVIIGGTSLKGGKGTIIGSLIGAAIMGILKNGFILLGFSFEMQIISIGLVIILAVVIDSLRTARASS
jgi:ribose transport system permease protein